MQTKKCCRCDKTKYITEFHKSSKGSHGVHSICKVCKQKYMLEYRLSGKLKISRDKYSKSERGKTTTAAYRKSDSNKKIQKTYSSNNRGSCNAKLARYRALKKLAMPKWLSASQKRQIIEFYKNRPKGYDGDHIIPINSKIVSGLHVPWNLQYLTTEQNRRKSNNV